MNWSDHLIVAPIVLPLVAGGLMLLLDGRNRAMIVAINLIATFALLAVSLDLLWTAADPSAGARVYRIGDWPAQFGIALVADRLSTTMLVLVAILGSTALVFSLARWHRSGSYFHPLFQFLLMGLNGAFLTGDLFNLFVFFEVLLAASYGLALHGSGHARVRAGLHYIAVNLAAASVFLIGVSLIYGSAGTLNMMELAARVPELGARERALLEGGVSVLAVAFLVKAAIWPLGFWLPSTYAAASAPAGALFAILTKVGIYSILRLHSILAEPEAEGYLLYGEGWLIGGGVATVIFASLGMLASQELTRLASFSVLVSSGTLLAVIGMNDAAIIGPALYYLVSSTLAIAALFLLTELVERGRAPADDILAVTLEAYGLEEEEDAGETHEVGVAVPAILAALGIAFIACGLLIAGMPPLSGFVAKFAILTGVLRSTGPLDSPEISIKAWILIATLLVSGFITVVATVRAGIRAFWLMPDREVPRVAPIEIAPVTVLLFLCVVLTVEAGTTMRFMRATADDLRRLSHQQPSEEPLAPFLDEPEKK